MDYIQEELLRQRRALAALLIGGSEETREAADGGRMSGGAGGGETLAASLAAAAVSAGENETGLSDGRTAAEAAVQNPWKKLTQTAERAVAADAEPPEAAASRSSAETREGGTAVTARDASSAGREVIRPGAVSRRQAGAAPLWTTMQTADGGDAAAAWAAGGTERSGTNVREVSRAVQRDARRYDGGFSIY